MKKLITLRGNSGSGKTTIARALQEKFGKNTMLLSQDVIRRDILKTNDGAGTRANDVLIMLLEYGHAHNELVILEGILNSRWYTPLFDAAKALYGENICAYYYAPPPPNEGQAHGVRRRGNAQMVERKGLRPRIKRADPHARHDAGRDHRPHLRRFRAPRYINHTYKFGKSEVLPALFLYIVLYSARISIDAKIIL